MAILGYGHFAPAIELLPGERVLWEGGADRRGQWIPQMRVAFAFLLLLAALCWFFGLLSLLPASSRPPTDRAGVVAAQPAVSEADATHPVSSQSWSPLLLLLGSGLLTLTVAVVVEARLSNRNAWYLVSSERICIQSGTLGRCLTILDLDKVLSVRVSASWLERRRGLQSIEFLHAGTRVMGSGRLVARDQVVMAFVPADGRLVSDLVNSWLPRDNARRRRAEV